MSGCLRASLALTALLVAALAPASAARAQLSDQERARLHFNTATSYYDQGRYPEAAAQFRESYQLSGRAHILLNVARCHELAGAYGPAADVLDEYLAAEPNAPDRRTVETRAAQLRARAPAASASSVGGGGPDLLGPALVMAAGGAVAAAGVVTGILTLDTQARLEAECSPARVCDPSLRGDADTGQALAIATDVLLITGGVAVGAGLAWLLVALAGGGADDPTPTAACGPTGCVAGARGRF